VIGELERFNILKSFIVEYQTWNFVFFNIAPIMITPRTTMSCQILALAFICSLSHLKCCPAGTCVIVLYKNVQLKRPIKQINKRRNHCQYIFC